MGPICLLIAIDFVPAEERMTAISLGRRCFGQDQCGIVSIRATDLIPKMVFSTESGVKVHAMKAIRVLRGFISGQILHLLSVATGMSDCD